ncbi:MAG: HAMP domain-containing histidine kinase [Candidatus Melainabacteria bacterium]|nr:HAMP domain-containing histidine kinase [Candidatus Melainabacteria bacterium]
MQRRNIKLPISIKALILLQLTLLPQLLILTALYFYGKEESNWLESIRREAFVAVSINQIASAVFLAGGFHFLWLSTDKPEDKRQSLQFREITQKEISKLKAFGKNYPVKKLVGDKLTGEIDSHFQDTFSISSVSFDSDARAHLKKLRILSYDAFQRFSQYQRAASLQLEDLERAISRSMHSKQTVLLIALTGLICNILLTFSTMYLFNRKIIERLKLLVDNAALLPKRQQLVATVGGNDELSELNDVLVLVAERLQKAQQYNKNLLSIVAHDMCSPLASMNLSLAMIEDAEGEKLNLNDAAAISEASELIDLLVVRARDILNIEKLTQGDFNQFEDKFSEGSSASVQELSQLTRIELDVPDTSEKEAADRFHPGVMRRGLILFSLPMVVAAILFFFVAYTSQAEEKVLKAELNETALAVRVNRMIAFCMGSYGFLTNYLMYGKSEDKDKSLFFRQEELNAAAETNKLLQARSSLSEAFRQNLEGLQTLRHMEDKNFEQAEAGKLRFGDAPGLPLMMTGRRLMRLAISKQECLWKLSCEQTQSLSNLIGTGYKLRENLEKLLSMGIFSCMFLSLVSVFLFSRSVGSRLKIVQSNANRLPDRQHLAPELSGSDEIWYLDYVVHKADHLLDLNFRQRTALINTVAEDLRQPLKQVTQVLSRIDRSRIDWFSALAKRHFDLTLDNARRILSLIDTLLSAQSLEVGKIDLKPTSFSLRDLASDAVGALIALSDSRKVTILNECESLEIHADRERIMQVLINYLTNAINHSPSSSAVTLRSALQAQAITIEVVDQGPGLPAEMLTKVFERYFQTPDSKTRGQGYGLGLAICKMIAEAHSGSVGVRSMPEGGCCFYITIPHGIAPN